MQAILRQGGFADDREPPADRGQRGARALAIDHDRDGSMELKKREGYF